MRKLLTWIVVTLGIAALVRRLKRKAAAVEPAGGDDPAVALREKLASSRVETTPASETPATTGGSVDERRAGVHEEGRAALDEMREPSDDA